MKFERIGCIWHGVVFLYFMYYADFMSLYIYISTSQISPYVPFRKTYILVQ